MTIVEKSIKLQCKKINFHQDNFYSLDGHTKSIFYLKEAGKVILKIRLVDTYAHQSTQ